MKNAISFNEIKKLPRREVNSSKRDYGRLLIVGGSVGYTGAPTLAARAAVRGGAGLVFLGVPREIYVITAVKNDEAMPFPLPSDETGCFSADAVEPAMSRMAGCSAVVMGPGMGRSEGVSALTRAALLKSAVPLLLDADALWALSAFMPELKRAACPVILTPHEREFERMGGVLTGDRVSDAAGFAARYGCTLVLKGHETVVASPDGEIYVNHTGNAGMAKGGSGDVLSGLMGAMLCQLPLFDAVKTAVKTAVWLHGRAGDICADRLGEYGMTPSDVTETLPEAMKEITEE